MLCVSRALGFKVDEICPCYVCDKFIIHGITCTDKVFENGSLAGKSMSSDNVIDWCKECFDKVALLGNKATLKGNANGLYIDKRDIKTGTGRNSVEANLYWGSLKENLEFLLSNNFKKSLSLQFAGTTGGYLREIMKYVSSTSVIPFKIMFNRSYKEYFLAEKVFEYYWKTFAEEIISLSGAKIIFLVGGDDMFEENKVIEGNEILRVFEKSDKFTNKRLRFTEHSRARKRGQNIIKLYEWEDRLIVSVAINQRGMRNFSRYFQIGSGIIEILRAKVKDLVESQYSFSSYS